MTILSAYNSISSRHLPFGRRKLAQLIITQFLTVQLVFVMQQLQANAHSANSIQEPKDIRQLELGKPIEREIAGGQSHSYHITLGAGQYLELEVKHHGINIGLKLFDSDGKSVVEAESPDGATGPELIKEVAEKSGTYRLELSPLEKDAPTRRYEARLIVLREAAPKDRVLVEAFKLYWESRALVVYKEDKEVSDKESYEKAIALAERALATQERELGPEHLDVARTLYHLSSLNFSRGEYTKSETFLQRAMPILEKNLDAESYIVANSLELLAILYSLKGDYGRIEEILLRSLPMREKAFGPEHREVATSLGNLGTFYHQKGDYAKAEIFMKRGLEVYEKAHGPEHPDVAISLDGLGLLYRDKGDYAKAEPLHRRAITVLEKKLGPAHIDLANALNNLALLYHSTGKYAESETLYQRALAMREQLFGAEHPEVAFFLNNLASLYISQANYAKAEPLLLRGQAIYEKSVGPEHRYVAYLLRNLANLYLERRDFTKAEQLFQRTLSIFEKTHGPEHPFVAFTLNKLALLEEAKGNPQRALTLLARSLEVNEKSLAYNIAVGSERQKLAYLALFFDQFNRAVSLHAQSLPNDAQALRLAMTTELRYKGRGLDAMVDTVAPLRRRASDRDQLLLDQLASLRSQLSTLTWRGPGRTGLAAYQSQVQQLEDQLEKLEAEIGQQSVEFRSQNQTVTLEALQAAIPADAALIEFALYTPFDVKTSKRDAIQAAAAHAQRIGHPLDVGTTRERYIAYVLSAHHEPSWVELGEAAVINRAVAEWRKLISQPTSAEEKVRQQARQMDEMIMRPVRRLTGFARHLLLAPDGDLNLIPFAALVDENNKHLAESYSLSYLTSGRDLLRLQASGNSRSQPMVLADPIYGESLTGKTSAGQTSNTTGDIPLFFTPTLTAGEADAIKKMFPETQVLRRKEATETALKQTTAPRFLHIATHGFFLKDPEPVPENSRSFGLFGSGSTASDPAAGLWAARVKDPLLRSGLALAGANQRQSGNEDGILTALEAAGLDLWGTKLVVLSACDTGVGEVKNGEGVYGLRRALVLAGSESQVMSLWKVRDDATRDLMIDYYTELIKRKAGRGEALRQVQLRMLRNPRRSHPYFWAGFIQSGEWANLDGRR